MESVSFNSSSNNNQKKSSSIRKHSACESSFTPINNPIFGYYCPNTFDEAVCRHEALEQGFTDAGKQPNCFMNAYIALTTSAGVRPWPEGKGSLLRATRDFINSCGNQGRNLARSLGRSINVDGPTVGIIEACALFQQRGVNVLAYNLPGSTFWAQPQHPVIFGDATGEFIGAIYFTSTHMYYKKVLRYEPDQHYGAVLEYAKPWKAQLATTRQVPPKVPAPKVMPARKIPYYRTGVFSKQNCSSYRSIEQLVALDIEEANKAEPEAEFEDDDDGALSICTNDSGDDFFRYHAPLDEPIDPDHLFDTRGEEDNARWFKRCEAGVSKANRAAQHEQPGCYHARDYVRVSANPVAPPFLDGPFSRPDFNCKRDSLIESTDCIVTADKAEGFRLFPTSFPTDAKPLSAVLPSTVPKEPVASHSGLRPLMEIDAPFRPTQLRAAAPVFQPVPRLMDIPAGVSSGSVGQAKAERIETMVFHATSAPQAAPPASETCADKAPVPEPIPTMVFHAAAAVSTEAACPEPGAAEPPAMVPHPILSDDPHITPEEEEELERCIARVQAELDACEPDPIDDDDAEDDPELLEVLAAIEEDVSPLWFPPADPQGAPFASAADPSSDQPSAPPTLEPDTDVLMEARIAQLNERIAQSSSGSAYARPDTPVAPPPSQELRTFPPTPSPASSEASTIVAAAPSTPIRVPANAPTFGAAVEPVVEERSPGATGSEPLATDEDITHTSIIDMITSALDGFAGEAFSDIAIIAGPLSAIGLSIFHIVDGVLSGYSKWWRISIDVAGLVAGINSALACLVRKFAFSDSSLATKARALVTRCVLTHMISDTSAAAPWIELPCKLVGIVVGVLGSVILGKTFTPYLSAISGAVRVTDVAGSIITMVAKLLGFDVDGTKEIDTECLAKREQIDAWLSKPVSEWVGDSLVEIKALSAECNAFSSKIKRGVQTDATAQFGKKLGELDKRLCEIMADLASRRTRPPPFCIYLWSTQGGLGKTELATYLPTVVAKRVKGFNPKVFTNFADSKHVCAYHGEHTFFMDEVGAQAQADFQGTHPYNILNGLVGTAPFPLPAANLEAKNQIPRPLLVVMAANNPYSHTSSPLTTEARDAQRTRIVEIEVRDPHYNPTRNRQNQPHRRPDFSHLEFRVQELPTSQPVTMRIDGIINLVANGIVNNVATFRQRENRPIPEENFIQHQGEVVDVSAGALDKKFCIWIAGVPGSRKSTEAVMIVRNAFNSLGWPVLIRTAGQDLTEVELNPSRSTVIILDDYFDLTKEGQQLAMDVYNRANEKVVFVVCSNFGPEVGVTSFGAWRRAQYQVAQVEVPGFARRFGFDRSSCEALVCVKTKTTFTTLYDGEPVNDVLLVNAVQRHMLEADYLQMLPSLPDPLPFSAPQADIWLKMSGVQHSSEIISRLTRCCSLRAATWLAREMGRQNTHNADISSIVRNIFLNVSRTTTDARIYVHIDHVVYFLDGRVAHVGDYKPTYNWELRDEDYYLLGPEHAVYGPVTAEQVKAVYCYEASCDPIPDMETILFIQLLRLRDDKVDTWYAMLRKFPVGFQAHFDTLRKRGAAAWEWFCKHASKAKRFLPLIAAGAAIVSCIGGLYYMFRKKERKLPQGEWRKLDMSQADRPLHRCEFCEQELRHLCPAINVQSSAAKGRPGGMHFAKQKYKHMFCSDQDKFRDYEREIEDMMERAFGDDVEPTVRMEAAFYDAVHDMEARGLDTPSRTYKARFQGIPMRVSHNWNNGRLARDIQVISDDEYSSDDESASVSTRGFEQNVVSVENEMTGLSAYGMLMNSNVLRFGTHLMHGGVRSRLIVAAGKCYAKVVYEVPGTDISYAELCDASGKPYSFPGIKSITNKLLCLDDLEKITKVSIVVAGEPTKVLANCWFERTMAFPVASKDQLINKRAFTVQMGAIDSHGLKQGKCGSQLLYEKDGDVRYIGMFATIRYGKQYVFTSCSIEEWNAFCASRTSTSAASQPRDVDPTKYARADNLIQPKEWRAPVYVPRQLFRHFVVDNVEPDYEPVGPGLKRLYHVPTNKMPFDPECKKVPLYDHEFAGVFGLLKAPALQLTYTERNHPELIPADANGKRRAFNIRLEAANGNVPLGAPDSDDHLVRLYRASDLGRHYAVMLGKPNLSPLSKEDAIWGNGTTIDPLRKSTSVGAAYHMLFPKAADKGSLFKRGVHEFVGAAGAATEQWIDDQWECWKAGEHLTFPSSVSTKAECLPLEKIWKKRLINIVDPVSIVNHRRILQPIQSAFAKLGELNPFQIQMDPLRDFSLIANHLDKHPNKADFDVKNFDLTTKVEVLDAVAEFFSGVYDAGVTLRRALHTSLQAVAFVPFLIGSDLIAKSGGVPSGMWGTSLVDSAAMHLMVYEYTCTFPGGADPSFFRANVSAIHGGDDCVLSWSDTLANLGFSSDGFCEFMLKQFGMTVTPPSKVVGAGTRSDRRSLQDVSFCSRQFTFIPGMTYITGRLKAESMSSALCWTTPEGLPQALETLEDIQLEFAAWDDEYYDRFVAAVTKLRLPLEIKGIKNIRAELRNQIVGSRSAQKFNSEQLGFRLSYSAKIKPAIYQPQVNKEMDPSTISRRFREAFITSRDVAELKGRCEYAAMKAVVPIRASMQTAVYDHVRITYPQDWSPSFFSDVLYCCEGTIPEWVEASLHLKGNDTKNGRKAVYRRMLAIAMHALSEPYADIKPLQQMWREKQTVDLAAALPVAKQAAESIDRAALARHDQSCGGTKPESPLTISIRVSDVYLAQLKKLRDDYDRANGEYEVARAELEAWVADRPNPTAPIDTSTAPGFVRAICAAIRSSALARDNARIDFNNLVSFLTVEPRVRLRDVPCSAPSAGSTSGEPPIVRGGASSMSTAGSGEVVGVAPNAMPAMAMANAEPVAPLAGMATTMPMSQITGGMTGMEPIVTAYGENVMTLAAKPIFKEIIPIPTNISEGTILYDAEVDPWNERIMNPFAIQWANLHTRFFGSLMVSFQFITATTVIGAIKVYYVPAILQRSIRLNQQSLDATGTQLELTLNSAGVATIELKPTLMADAKTGIYRGNGPFGRLVVICSSNIRNAYVNTTQLDVKVNCYLGPGSFYDIPATISNIIPAGLSTALDINPFECFLALDGDFTDGINYMLPPTAGSCSYSNFPASHQATSCVPSAKNVLYSIFGSANLLGSPTSNAQIAMSYYYFKARGYCKASGTTVTDVGGNWQDLAQKIDQLTESNDFISWSQVSGAVISGFGKNGLTQDNNEANYVRGGDPSSMRFSYGTTIDLDQVADQPIANYIGWYPCPPTIGGNVDGECSAVAHENQMQYFDYTSKSFLCTQSAAKGDKPGATLRRATIARRYSVVPLVAAALRGVTCRPTLEDAEAMQKVRAYGLSPGSSIVTKFKTGAGDYLCEVIRNEHGLFVRANDDRRYSITSSPLTDYIQEHRVEGTGFPVTDFAASALFAPRVATTAGAHYMRGNGPEPFTPSFSEIYGQMQREAALGDKSAAAAAGAAVEGEAGAAAGAGGSGASGFAGPAGNFLGNFLMAPWNYYFQSQLMSQQIAGQQTLLKQQFQQQSALAGQNYANAVARRGGFVSGVNGSN